MRYKLLGRSGLRVSELSLGTMTFGEDWGSGSNYETSRQIFETYAAAGGNFIDTANLYTNGTSEKYVGEFIKGDRNKWVVATKYSLNNQAKAVNEAGNHRKNMVQSVEASLRRLNVEYIDLLWLHCWDYTTPVEEVMRAFDDLVRAGKALYIGVSDTPAWVISQANTLALLRGWTPFIALQIEYSLKERTPERELLPMAKAFGLGVTPWGPLGGGLLTGKYNKALSKDTTYRFGPGDQAPTPEQLKLAEEVVNIAKDVGHTPSQVALSWIVQQGDNIIPIIGARTLEQLKDNLGYEACELSPQHILQLNKASHIDLGFPLDFFHSQMVQDFTFNGTLKQIHYSPGSV